MMALLSVPGWRTALDKAIEKSPKSNVYQLATISTTKGAIQPYVRSLVHRSIIGRPSAPLLLTTTDIRTPKSQQIAHCSHVEVAWWLADAQEQFRISGTAYILPSPDFPSPNDPLKSGTGELEEVEKEGITSAAAQLREMFYKAGLAEKDVDWERKRVDTFESMSGHMKASWARPVPGSTLGSYDAANDWPQSLPKLSEAEGAEKELVERALRNFALVVINPSGVDHVELGAVPNRRTIYSKDGEKWRREIIVP